jgi:hypothetical protein
VSTKGIVGLHPDTEMQLTRMALAAKAKFPKISCVDTGPDRPPGLSLGTPGPHPFAAMPAVRSDDHGPPGRMEERFVFDFYFPCRVRCTAQLFSAEMQISLDKKS